MISKKKSQATKIQITTKTGDSGLSSLANGQRVAKDSTYFRVIGSLDELNSWLGLLAVELDNEFSVWQERIYGIQDTLFYVGAEIALSPKAVLPQEKVQELEHWSDILSELLQDNWHTKFILPGGTLLGAHCDIARTVCRRTECELVAHQKEATVSAPVLAYINRLSDFLYLLRCYLNQQQEFEEQEFVAQTKK